MNIRWWVLPSTAIVAIGAAQCGGDDSDTTTTTGTTGTTTGGRSGSGGTTTGTTSTSTTGGSGGVGGTTGGSAGSAGTTGGTGGTGGSAGSAGAPDGGGTAGTLDAGADRAVDAGLCPAVQPASGSVCTGTTVCPYVTMICSCRAVDGGRAWECLGRPDAGNPAGCPGTKPADGSSCADAGLSPAAFCTYGANVFCHCIGNGDWQCGG